MASRDPLSMAQSVTKCTLCEDEPAELNCNTCQVGLCDGCVSKHITSQKYSKHDIVPFIAGKFEIQLSECETHSQTKCDLHCLQCNTAVCVKCIAGSHKNHNFVEMSGTLASLTEIIKQEITQLETLIAEEYQKIKTEMKTKLSKLQNDYQSLKKMISDYGKLWHREVDIILAQINKDVEGMEKRDMETLNKQFTEIENILTEVKNTAEKNKQILKSNDTSQMINHISKNEEFCNVPARSELSPPLFKPLKIEGRKLLQQFGTLKSSTETKMLGYKIKMKENVSSLTSVTELINIPTIIKTTNTGGDIYSVTTTDNNQLWIGRFSSMDRLDIHGTTLETINTLSGLYSDGLTMTQDGHLIYTDFTNNTVNMVRNGKIETIIRTEDWKPTRLCTSSTRDLLVCLHKYPNNQNKVARYSGYKLEQELKGDPSFATGGNFLFIAENSDQNICISDVNAHKVVTLNKWGKLQFNYNGNLASNKNKSFDPQGIATDSQSRILIADHGNNCIHIINHEGKFLRYIDNCQLNRPKFLYVDRSRTDQLFVSCGLSVKIIKYLK